MRGHCVAHQLLQVGIGNAELSRVRAVLVPIGSERGSATLFGCIFGLRTGFRRRLHGDLRFLIPLQAPQRIVQAILRQRFQLRLSAQIENET